MLKMTVWFAKIECIMISVYKFSEHFDINSMNVIEKMNPICVFSKK